MSAARPAGVPAVLDVKSLDAAPESSPASPVASGSEAHAPLTWCGFYEQGECLGILILMGHLTGEAAASIARFMRLHPGGELLAFCVPSPLPEDEYRKAFDNRGRLLTFDEAHQIFDVVKTSSPQCPRCGILNPFLFEGACQSCGEPIE